MLCNPLVGHFCLQNTLSEQWCVTSEKYLHVVVLLVNILQVLLELLQLSEAVVCQLPVLLQLAVHFLKLLSGEMIKKE